MISIADFRKALQKVRSWAEFTHLIAEVPKTAEILYGPYDAIWPTVGVEGCGWFCLWCGTGDAEFIRPFLAQVSAETHAEHDHAGVQFTFTEVHLDPDEVA